MLIHPDRPFRDAHEHHAERTATATRRHLRRTQAGANGSADARTDLLAPFRRIAAALS